MEVRRLGLGLALGLGFGGGQLTLCDGHDSPRQRHDEVVLVCMM